MFDLDSDMNLLPMDGSRFFTLELSILLKEDYDLMRKMEWNKNVALMLCFLMVISLLNPLFVSAGENDISLQSSDEIAVTENVYDPITIDLQATGLDGDLFSKSAIEIPVGEVTQDGFTLDNHTAMGALVYYCQENGVAVQITDSDWGWYVYQIGTDPDNENGWMYYVNGESPGVGASEYALTDGDSLRFGHWSLGLYEPIEYDIPVSDNQWVKNGNTVLDALVKFQQPDGSFWWTEEIEGLAKSSTVQSLSSLVDLGSGGSSKHQAGAAVNLSDAPKQLKEAIDGAIDWYLSNHNPASNWEGLPALKAAGEDLNNSPWETDQEWRTVNPGFDEDTTENDHIHYIFRLLAVGLNPSNAWERNLFAELAAQQNMETGAIGSALGKHIWAMVALDTGKMKGYDVGSWNETNQIKAADYLIEQQESDGLFADLDTTGWALTALSSHREKSTVDDAINKAVNFLASRQKDNGGFQPLPASWGTSPENANTNAAVIAGLAAVGEDLLPGENILEIKDDTKPLEITLKDGASITTIKIEPSEEDGLKVATLPKITVTAESGHETYGLMIPQGTKVSGPEDWDGSIQMPRPLDSKTIHISDGETKAAVQVGYSAGSLRFDQAVRLRLPAQAGKSAGFIQSGEFHEITEELAEDYGTGLNPGEAVKIDVDGDLIIWITHFTTFIAYDKTQTTPPGSGGTTSGSDPQASLSVQGDRGKTILASTEEKIDSNETVLSFTEKVLDKQGISHDISGGYLRAIDGLAELDKGPESGWIFSINGRYPEVGASSVSVNADDRIRWEYTTELLSESGDAGITSDQLEEELDLENARLQAIEWILNHQDFTVHSNFADWDALALARNGEDVPEAYRETLEALLMDNKGDFRLVTDTARILLTATALGDHGENVYGVNFLEKLLNHENMLMQGINGPAHALLALDAYQYEAPAETLWNREKLVDQMLEMQKRDGGFSLSERAEATGDIDLTAMVLQALAPYQDQEEVKEVTDKALSWLELKTFDNSESIAQTVLALSSLKLDPANYEFDQVEASLLHELVQYMLPDGGFSHRKNGESSEIANQQALMALNAYQRFVDEDYAFYDMRDAAVSRKPDPEEEKSPEISLEGIDLTDEAMVSDWALEWVKKAVAHGLMSGVSETELRFDPKRELTRTEFAVLMVKMQDAAMHETTMNSFQDVEPGSWYEGYVTTVRNNGWMSGVSENEFAPHRSISRQEMAVVLGKVLDLKRDEPMLAPEDFDDAADWAKAYVQPVYHHRLMVGDGRRFMPESAVTREMAAVIMVKLYENKFD